jgi:hypothetical protein
MIRGMIESVVPILLLQVGAIPDEQKRTFVTFVIKVCQAYLDGDRATYDRAISAAQFPHSWVEALDKALWSNGNSS